MRVLELTQRFPPALGGVENHVMNLASKLSESGVTTEVFTTDLMTDVPLRRLGDDGANFPFTVRRFRANKIAEMPHGLGIVAPSMIPKVLSDPPDLIHAHAYGYFPTFVGSFAGKFRGIPLVITPHSDAGRPSLRKSLFDLCIPLVTLRAAQRVIALTRSEASYLSHLRIPEDRIRVISNGVTLAEFAGIGPRSGGGEPCRVLFVGRCYPQQKGLLHLVRAMALLPSVARAHLDIVGEDWGGVAPVASLATELGVGDQISILGPLVRWRLLQAYASADLMVLPSLFESFPIVLLEAMAAGLPVVASRVGGIAEVVEEGRTGLLVEPGNPRDLAHALELLISDPKLRRAMGRRGRERAQDYSWDMVAQRVRQVYEEVMVGDGG